MKKSHITFYFINGLSYTVRNIEPILAHELMNLDFSDSIRYTKYDKFKTSIAVPLQDVSCLIYKTFNIEFVVKNPSLNCVTVKTKVTNIKDLRTKSLPGVPLKTKPRKPTKEEAIKEVALAKSKVVEKRAKSK